MTIANVWIGSEFVRADRHAVLNPKNLSNAYPVSANLDITRPGHGRLVLETERDC